ncbi:hypothetical protein EDD21DRAFT_386370 [Dissophora ornata]|nr:hypothetical protein EDD21DRAFT_386370 [Dissophora ornata]
MQSRPLIPLYSPFMIPFSSFFFFPLPLSREGRAVGNICKIWCSRNPCVMQLLLLYMWLAK